MSLVLYLAWFQFFGWLVCMKHQAVILEFQRKKRLWYMTEMTCRKLKFPPPPMLRWLLACLFGHWSFAFWGQAGDTFLCSTRLQPIWIIFNISTCQPRVFRTTSTLHLSSFWKSLQNGALSALPHLGFWLSSLLLSYLSDWLIRTDKCSPNTVRKIMTAVATYGPALSMLGLAFTPCNPSKSLCKITWY